MHRPHKPARTIRYIRSGEIDPGFRDQEALTSSSNLGETIRLALSNSLNLVVLCSPAAATSRWTNEEIATFKQLNPTGRIYPDDLPN